MTLQEYETLCPKCDILPGQEICWGYTAKLVASSIPFESATGFANQSLQFFNFLIKTIFTADKTVKLSDQANCHSNFDSPVVNELHIYKRQCYTCGYQGKSSQNKLSFLLAGTVKTCLKIINILKHYSKIQIKATANQLKPIKYTYT